MARSMQINLIFRFLQSRQKVQIWLYEQNDLRIEGRIIVSLLAVLIDANIWLLVSKCSQTFT